jgi:hypothetical protein
MLLAALGDRLVFQKEYASNAMSFGSALRRRNFLAVLGLAAGTPCRSKALELTDARAVFDQAASYPAAAK